VYSNIPYGGSFFIAESVDSRHKGFVPSLLKHKKAIAREGWQPVLEAGIVVAPSLSRVTPQRLRPRSISIINSVVITLYEMDDITS
jgi:hypothetical protein